MGDGSHPAFCFKALLAGCIVCLFAVDLLIGIGSTVPFSET